MCEFFLDMTTPFCLTQLRILRDNGLLENQGVANIWVKHMLIWFTTRPFALRLVQPVGKTTSCRSGAIALRAFIAFAINAMHQDFERRLTLFSGRLVFHSHAKPLTFWSFDFWSRMGRQQLCRSSCAMIQKVTQYWTSSFLDMKPCVACPGSTRNSLVAFWMLCFVVRQCRQKTAGHVKRCASVLR